MSPPHKAALAGDLPELKRQVAEGADIHLHDETTGHTPLMAACLSPHANLEVMRFLLDHGAEVNAVSHATREENKPLIALAVSNPLTDCEKIRLLIEHGADISYRSCHGYTLLIWAACGGREDVIEMLLSLGAPVDEESTHRESALSVLSRTGRFGTIAKVLARGADPAPLQWTPLMRAVALGTLQEMDSLIEHGADLEATDRWERTPLLLGIHSGDTGKTERLLARGANRGVTGRCGKPPMHYPLDRDDTRMLQWLIDQGFDLNQEDEFGHPPLMEAAEKSAPGCFKLLVANGAEWLADDDDIISGATHPEIVAMLYEHGEDLGKLDDPVLRDFIGLRTAADLPVSEHEYREGRFRRFGNANPERIDVPFWNAMVRCGWSGHQAAKQFGDDSSGRNNPVWSHDRFGMSLTMLPDGRFIQIAGEHEDHYDPDFCIYNDVFIHDGKGGFEIFGYPEEVFPPTDFHTATLFPPWIYIIGNLGYPHARQTSGRETPVFRLHTETGAIKRVATRGTAPGWIHGHRAVIRDSCIRITGGRIFGATADGNGELRDNGASFDLDLETMFWRCLADD